MGVMIDANVLRGIEHSDILITVNLAGYTTLDFSRAREIVPLGYEAAQSKTKVLETLSVSEEEWQKHLAQREARRVNSVAAPEFVEVQGTSSNLASDIQKKLSSTIGKPVDITRLENDLTELVGLGRFDSVSYSATNRNGKPGLLIIAEEKDYSPPWLKPGFVVDGSDPDNVQFAFGGRVTFLDVGGYRSEARVDYSIGSTYGIGAEYYRPITPVSRWFIAPQVEARRSPLNLYSESTLLAEYKINKVAGRFDVGYGFDRFSELRLGYEIGYLDVSRWIGSPLLPSPAGRTGATRLRYAMDRLDNPVVPRRGTALLAESRWVDTNPGGNNRFPSAEMTLAAFRPVQPKASIYLVASGGTVFGHEQTGLPLFGLGGPSRLAAYGINEFLTNQYFYFRPGYLHRLTTMPAFLGSGMYFAGHYEVGKAYGLPNVSGLAQDGVAGVIMETIIGPVMVGGSVGGSGHRKWFFQLGRIF
jgi:NTE family protein